MRTIRRELNSRELVTIYIMVMVAGPLASTGLVHFLLPNMVGFRYYATPENEWAAKFHQYIPQWFGPTDNLAIRDFYEGGNSVPWREWLFPLAMQCLFALGLYLVMTCVNRVLRKQWIEKERLVFPTTYLPLRMADDSESASIVNPFFRNRLIWMGFSGVVLLRMVTGFHSVIPGFPTLKLLHIDIAGFFVDRPWNAMGDLEINIYPWVIALIFILPVGLSFSCWFFFLFTKAENVFASAAGFSGSSSSEFLGRFPDIDSQGAGAFLGLFIVSIWTARRHILSFFKEDRKTVSSLILGIFFLLGWMRIAGLSTWVGLLFLTIFLVYATVFTRIRSATGLTWLSNPMYPTRFVTNLFGAAAFGTPNLTILTCVKFHTFNPKAILMPFQMGGYKLADSRNVKGITLAMFVAIIVSILVGSWAGLNLIYERGGNNCSQWRIQSGRWPFEELSNFVEYRSPADATGMMFSAMGLVAYVFLAMMKLKFLWWPFHPIGYAMANTSEFGWMWSSFFFE